MIPLTPHNDRRTDGERAAAERLRRWSVRPPARANLISLACAAVSVFWLLMASAGSEDRLSLLRQAAVLFIAFHGVTYVVWLRMIRRLVSRGIAEGKVALAAYTDPRRVTNLDLAMFWVTFFLLVPHIV
jgi:hypothetical protein